MERERVAELGSPTLRALYEGFGWDLDGLLAMTEDVIAQTERLHERELDRALRSRVGVPLDVRRPAGRVAPVAGARVRHRVRRRPGAAGAAGDAGGDGHPSRPPAEHRARHRQPAGQDPARLLRADPGARPRDAGDPAAGRPRRLAGAVPRGRPRAALRAHVADAAGRGSRPRRQRRHRGLGVPVRPPGDDAGVARLAGGGAAAGLRPLQRAVRPAHAAPLLRQAGVRAGAARRRARRMCWASATSTTWAGRRSSRRPRQTGWWTSIRCSTAPPTCGRGRSRRRSPGTWRSAGAASGSAAGRRACCCASCGSSASRWTPTACCTS